MQRLLCRLAVIILLVSNAYAAILSGRIYDAETSKPVEAATIWLVGEGRSTASDDRGAFELKDLEVRNHRIVVTHVGYDASDTLEISAGEGNPVFIRLNPQPWVLNDIVITGTRSPHLLKDVPVQTKVVSRRDFQRTGATTVDEALKSSIGIQINEDLSGQGATIRGIEGDRVLVLIDGERAVGRVRGSIDLSQYSLSDVEKIEVIKGTGSTLYGSDAIGGVINIITKKPEYHTLDGRFNGDVGTYKSFNPAAELTYGNSNLALSIDSRFFVTDGFDLDKSTPHTNGQEDIARWNLNSQLRTRLSDRWSTTISGRFMREKRDWIESEVVAKSVIEDTTYVYDDEETNRRYEGSVSLDYLSGDTYSMKLRLFGTWYRHNWNKFAADNWIDTSDTEDRFFEATYTSNYVIGPNHVATYGLEFNYQDLVSTELSQTKEGDRTVAGYLQYEYKPVQSFTMLPGIRVEDHSSFGTHVNPSLNVMYAPDDQFKLRGFVGRGFRAPSIKEQYFVFDHTAAGYKVIGGRVQSDELAGFPTTSFKAETSINSSISAEFSYGVIGLHRITYFYNHLDDLIDFELIGFPGEYWRGVYVYQNVETAVTRGVEWESRVRLNSALDVSFSYTYLDNVIIGTDTLLNEGTDSARVEDTGNQLLNRPKHTFKFYVTGLIDKWSAGASLWGDYHSNKLWVPRSNTGGNEGVAQQAPSRTTLNLNVFKRFNGSLEAYLRIENILDKTDVTYGYWPGRMIFAGFKWNLTYGQ
jgi:outer membrane receptor for ferrienterochelin and colicins